MDFDTIIDLATELLRKRGRITRRTLKRQFSLDDGALDDLVHELVLGQRIAVEDGPEVLVVAGEAAGAASAAAPASVPVTVRSVPPPPPAPVSRSTPASAVREVERAERRQLTVLFCDLVGSTELSGRLDPEDLRSLLRSYQQAANGVVERYGGYVAQYLGDGILVYFGYPTAHEDAAERAVRAALDILSAVSALSQRAERDFGSRLAVRLGIHTGLVVVGEMGEGAGRQQLALGEAPNIAARLQALAEPSTALASEATIRFVRDRFHVEDLGLKSLKGAAEPVRVLRLQGERDAGGFSEAHTRVMVGRAREIATLRHLWARASAGQGHAVLVRGEAGIGKSRLVRALLDDVAAGAAHLLLRCSPYQTHTALSPFVEHLERRLRLRRDMPPSGSLALLEAHLREVGLPVDRALPVFAQLLALPVDPQARASLPPSRLKQETIALLAQWLDGVTLGRPAVIVIEDLHWADATTLDLLSAVVAGADRSGSLIVMTCRPELRPPWSEYASTTELTLSRFGLSEVAELVAQATGGKRLASDITELLASKTDGIPLFVEEVTKLFLESGFVQEVDGRLVPAGALAGMSVPSTLQDSLMARLDRLGGARSVAQLGATIGREFSYDLLRAVVDEAAVDLDDALERLVAAELLFEQQAPRRFVFKHALIQDVAYQSLLRTTRQRYHADIAAALERGMGGGAEGHPEIVARHLDAAGLSARALPYWRKAGERAVAQSAHQEAIAHLGRAIENTAALVDADERARTELQLQITIGVPLAATLGYGAPEVRRAYARAGELSARTGDTRESFATLYGVWRASLLRAEYGTALQLGEQLLSLATDAGAPTMEIAAQRGLGSALFYVGQYGKARAHHGRVLASRQDAETVRRESQAYEVVDSFVASSSYAAWIAALSGALDEAVAQGDEAVRTARGIDHPFSVTLALSFDAWLHQFRRDVARTRERAEEAVRVSTDVGHRMWIGWNRVLLGWVRSEEGLPSEGAALVRQGIDEWRSTGSELGLSYFLTLLAESELAAGKLDLAADALAEAEAFAARTNERFYAPEIHRVRGAVHRAAGSSEGAARSIERAIDVSRSLSCPLFLARAACAGARAGLDGLAVTAARDALRGLEGGLDHPDVAAARALVAAA